MAFQSRSLKDYNQKSSWQLEIDLTAVPILLNHLNSAESLTEDSLRLADFGCSEGFNSMFLFCRTLELFRKSSSRPVSILHTDLPDNNWAVFFHTINDSEDSYHSIEDVFYSAVGKSFYRQLAPPNSIHVGFSAFALHYLSKAPLRSGNEVELIYPQASAQAISDVTANLELRIKELVVGGNLTVIVAGREDCKYKLLDLYMQPAKNLARKGVITDEEIRNYFWPSYQLNRDEWNEILKNFDGKVEVKTLEIKKSICPFYTEFKNGGSFEIYKEKLQGFISVLTRNPLFHCLSSRTPEEKESIFELIKQEILETIDEQEVCIYYTTVILQKLSN
jgi:hypothetical protein